MKKLLILCLLLFLTACTIRMGAFAPRRPDTPQHRNLVSSDCLECHDISQKKDHQADEDCLRCHHLIKGV